MSSKTCFLSTLFIEKYVVSNRFHAFVPTNNDLIIRAKCIRFQCVVNSAVALLLTCTKVLNFSKKWKKLLRSRVTFSNLRNQILQIDLSDKSNYEFYPWYSAKSQGAITKRKTFFLLAFFQTFPFNSFGEFSASRLWWRGCDGHCSGQHLPLEVQKDGIIYHRLYHGPCLYCIKWWPIAFSGWRGLIPQVCGTLLRALIIKLYAVGFIIL